LKGEKLSDPRVGTLARRTSEKLSDPLVGTLARRTSEKYSMTPSGSHYIDYGLLSIDYLV